MMYSNYRKHIFCGVTLFIGKGGNAAMEFATKGCLMFKEMSYGEKANSY